VCASLRIGKVMKVAKLTGAINYWREATDIMTVMKRAYPGRVHEFRYEDFVRDTKAQLQALLEFLGESYEPAWFDAFQMRESDHSTEGVLTQPEVERINRLCSAGRRRYGYEVETVA